MDRLIKLLPVVALLVAGCKFPEEAPRYYLDVVNYSPNAYIVQTTWEDGGVSDIAVAPRSRTDDSYQDLQPVQAVVYEQDCSHKIVTVKLVPQYWILIDQSGNVSTPATMTDHESKGEPWQGLPTPSACP